jgi:hypothetical protein
MRQSQERRRKKKYSSGKDGRARVWRETRRQYTGGAPQGLGIAPVVTRREGTPALLSRTILKIQLNQELHSEPQQPRQEQRYLGYVGHQEQGNHFHDDEGPDGLAQLR